MHLVHSLLSAGRLSVGHDDTFFLEHSRDVFAD
jgi:hypothetical protein